MTRGLFSSIANYPEYKKAVKQWYIELQRSDFYWYELIANSSELAEANKYVSNQLKELQKEVETQLEKRFIYFIATRKKVRFSIRKKPKYSFFGNNLILYLEIGKEKRIRKIKINDIKIIELSDKLITFTSGRSEDSSITTSVHDFLQMYGIQLGIDTEIHYIGYTKNPSGRLMNRQHRGLTDTFYNISNEEFDFFVYCNLFKVTSYASNPNSPINVFILPNSMIDEVNVDKEGKIIEKALISYFDTERQELNKQNEKGELKNSLAELAQEFNINSLKVYIEMEKPSEYYRFFSRKIAPSDKHSFVCRNVDGEIEITKGENED